jgi:CubicO group peptidase (beta-lactamase class C family)
MKKFLIIFAAVVMILAACGGQWAERSVPIVNQVESGESWPTKEWRTSPAEQQGMDEARLVEMFAYIDEEDWDLDGLLIIRNGTIVAEKYYPPYSREQPHELYSVTKSIVSTLIGIAMADGAIEDVNQKVITFFPNKRFDNLDARKADIQLEDLLTMRSGLAWLEGWTAYQGLGRSSDAISYVLDLEMAVEPGSRFNYCSGCSHVLAGIIQETTGMNLLDYAHENLFNPLGISDVTWETDRNGIPMGGWGLELTPREMAKLGYLYLNNGRWEDQQIVTEAWIRDSTAAGMKVDPRTDYGYQWWIIPELNLYAAQGLYGQKIYVLPDQEMVVVITADLRGADIGLDLVEDWIIPAIILQEP